VSETADVGPFDYGAWTRSLSVRGMTLEDKGAYIDLLSFGWMHGGIPAKASALRVMLGLTSGRFRKVWEKVGPMWKEKPGEPGRLINERQEIERSKREALSERMRKVRRSGDVEATYGPT
jgi:uncharacterized protein YdaU (DUF1376 family)